MENNTKPLYWPKYIEKTFKNRTLAYFFCKEEEGTHQIVTENEHKILLERVEDLIQAMFNQNLLLFVKQIATFPYLYELIELGCEVMCDEAGKTLAIKIKGARNTTRWIVQIERWDYTEPSLQMLADLRATFTHCKVGTQTTPGALGQALMRKSWKEQFGDDWKEHQHRRPPAICIEELRKTGFGGRSDLIRTDIKNLPRAIEHDQKNAYAYHFMEQPTGHCSPTWKESAWSHLVSFAEVEIEIVTPLPLGCFPVRQPWGELTYPREPGIYRGMYWSTEVALMEEMGCLVRYVGKGWGWDKMTSDPAGWVFMMERLRDTAPSPRAAYLIKLAIVAGIGRHNLPDEKYVLVSKENRQEEDRPLSAVTENGLEVFDYWIQMQLEDTPSSLPHWHYYTLCRCRISLYYEALRYIDHLLATNTDALILHSDASLDTRSVTRKSGEWGNRELTNVTLPKLRHLISDQKTVQPGIRKKKYG